MKYKPFLTVVICIISTIQGFSQPFNMTWEKIIDGVKINSLLDVNKMTSDLNGDFIIVGSKDTGEIHGMFLKKLHPNGSTIFDISRKEFQPNSVITDINGNIYIGGWQNSDFWEICKYDSSGIFQWSSANQLSSITVDRIQMGCDSLENIYFGLNYVQSSVEYTLIGKININGSLIRSYIHPTQFNLTYLNVRSNQEFVTVFTGSSVEIINYDSTGSEIASHTESNFLINDGTIMNSNGQIYIAGKNSMTDSTNILKFDPALNIIWRKSNPNTAYDAKLEYSGEKLYVLFSDSSVNLFCYDIAGNIEWQRSANVASPGMRTLQCDIFGNAYVGIDDLTPGMNHKVTLQQYDSLGNLLFNITDSAYRRHCSEINLHGNYLIAKDFYTPNNLGYKLFGCNSLLVDSFSLECQSFQSKNDVGSILKKDNNGDLISICRMTDSVQYVNTYQYTFAIGIFKHDVNGNLIWKTQIRISRNPAILDVHIDKLNNIYLCGNADTTGSATAAFAVEISSSGQELWRNFEFNSGNPGYNRGRAITTDDGLNVYFGGSADTSFNNSFGFISKLDQTGNVQWKKYYYSVSGGGQSINGLCSINNHIYSLLQASSSSSVDFFVCDLDTAGTILSQTSNNHGQKALIYKMVMDNNRNMYCYGTCTNPVPSWYVAKFDSAGFFVGEWHDSISSSFNLGIAGIVLDGSGKSYLNGASIIGNQINYKVIGLDQNCNLMWVDSLDNYRPSNIGYSNGKIYSTTKGTLTDSASVICYDTLGTVLSRTYLPSDFSDYFSSFIEYDICADTNSFYVLGTINSDSSANDILFRRYDLFNTKVEDFAQVRENIVYPNPSTNNFKIIVPKNECDQLIVYNSAGELIQERKIDVYLKEISVDLATAGVYYYVLLSSGHTIERGKMIKL